MRLLSLVGVAVVAGAVPAADPAARDRFEAKVRPVLVARCQSCHAGAKVRGGLDLSSAAGLRAGGDTGPAVVPGDPDKSLLIRAVRHAGELTMPPAGKIPDAEVRALEEWVKAGADWPDTVRPDSTAPVSPVRPDSQVDPTRRLPSRPDPGPPAQAGVAPLFTPEQKAFWAFQPVKPSPPPAVRDGSWPLSPVDRFILAKLDAANLAPAARADPRTLVRRVTFDLTGLPPTPAEVDDYLQSALRDPHSAFESLVDRLLASPHYGERWGRHWLDVARYADSNGQDENTALPHAWRYRDWVVRAVNADKPVNEFIVEQIAGDLLPASPDPAVQLGRRTATGYLVVGPKLLAEPDKEKMLLDIADEQLDTLTRGVMGLTVSCARCHDHKFDPIPTRDYYGLLGVFTSTRTMQSLGTVAKAHEYRPPDPAADKLDADIAAAAGRVKKLEAEFGRTKDPDERRRIHEAAEQERATGARLTNLVRPRVAVHAVEDGSAAAYNTRPRNLYVQARGNYLTPKDEAPAVFPRVLAGEDQREFVGTAAGAEPGAGRTKFGRVRAASGRLELARWLTADAHPLTARVFVNRVWAHHFGAGLVRTLDNFGRLGDRPSHPELLDFLADRFVRDGWSLKKLHRLMLLTRTYQQASAATDAARTADPDNRLLSHYTRRRLEAEPIRDAMLAVSGSLDRTVGGHPAGLPGGASYARLRPADYDVRRRSLYLPVVRSQVFDFFQTFDFPDPSVTAGQRASTTVAPQALYLLNSPFVRAQADKLAARARAAADDPGRVDQLYRLAYSRPATAGDTAAALLFIGRYAEKAPGADAAARRRAGWAALAHAVLAGSEFVFVD